MDLEDFIVEELIESVDGLNFILRHFHINIGSDAELDPIISDRQRRFPDWNQELIEKSKVIAIGAGGLGSVCIPQFQRLGVRNIMIVDSDRIELSNLNRQSFSMDMVKKSKVVGIAENILRDAYQPMSVDGYECTIETLNVDIINEYNPDLILCLVDNDETRYYVSESFPSFPQIHCGITEEADQGFIFVQESEAANFSFFKPKDEAQEELENLENLTYAQAVWPLHIITGLVTFIGNNILQHKSIPWNHFQFNFSENAFLKAGFVRSSKRTSK